MATKDSVSEAAELVGSPPNGSSGEDAPKKSKKSNKPAKSAKSNQADRPQQEKARSGKDVPVMPLKRNTTRSNQAGRKTKGNGRSQRGNARGNGWGNGRGNNRHNNRHNNRNNNHRSRNYHYEEDSLADSDHDMNTPNGDSNSDVATKTIRGVLDTSRDGHGVLRVHYSDSEEDAYISTSQIRRFRLRSGDMIEGPGREPKENERYWGLLQVDTVNGEPVDKVAAEQRTKFRTLTPVYPDELIRLEIGEEPLSLRIIDMIAPIGKGQRSLIVSPPKAGKTTLLKNIATGVAKNHPEIHVMAVLVGERPEEVTDIRRHINSLTDGKGETAASNFDEPAVDQCRVAELALDRARRLVESGKDVVVLLDSITRLARAYNLAIPTSGRTLSGGFDPQALFPPKRFFGAARNFEVPGSLTIVGTALVDTGSRMDEVIYEEFKGTGNQEVHLDRRLAERRVHPAIDVQRSGTRRDDLLIEPMTYQSIITLHRMLDMLDREQRTETLIERLKRTKSNKEFLASLKDG